MKQKILLSIFACLLLTGCGCKHENVTEADCLNPARCIDCNAEIGKPAGHDWAEATCQAPKTCKTCGETEGEPGGHSTKRGKCAYCGEFDVSELHLPSISSYQTLRLLEDVETNPAFTVLRKKEETNMGMVYAIYVDLAFPEEWQMEGGSDFQWYLSYDPGTTFDVLDYEGMCWNMPSSDDAKSAYKAIKAHCEELYGKPIKTNYDKTATSCATWSLGEGSYYLQAELLKTNNIGVLISKEAFWFEALED